MFYIVYESRTGQVNRFVNKVRLSFERVRSPQTPASMLQFHRIGEGNLPEIGRPFHMLTYTDGFGVVPDLTQQFLELGSNGRFIQSIGSSGNKNWGMHQYGKAADIIAGNYGAAVSLKWELAGKVEDVVAFFQFLRRFEASHAHTHARNNTSTSAPTRHAKT